MPLVSRPKIWIPKGVDTAQVLEEEEEEAVAEEEEA
jgi:hypothetical protein